MTGDKLETIGIKERELREISDCDLCGKPVGGGGRFISFYRIRIDQVVLDLPNLQRQQGLELMLNPALAMVMGPDQDLAHRIKGKERTVCLNCSPRIHELYEMD